MIPDETNTVLAGLFAIGYGNKINEVKSQIINLIGRALSEYTILDAAKK